MSGASESTSHILVEEIGRVMLITLNRPEARNAMSSSMATAIGEALERAATTAEIGAVVVTGAGHVFCAGGDRRSLERGDSIHSLVHPEWGFGGMRHHFVPTPVIAAVNGPALGGGFELCLAADLVVAVPGAEMGLPEVAIGVPPNAGGALRLMYHLPRKRAMELILTGRPITSETAFEWGLVNRIVAPQQLVGAAVAWASSLADMDARTMGDTKRLAYGAKRLSIEDEATRWDRAPDP